MAKIAAAHRLAWDASLASGERKWLVAFHLQRALPEKLRLLAETCPCPDAGTLAVEQLLAHESRERAAAFALAAHPAALAGALTVGAEGVADLGRLAAGLLTVDGELKWQERLQEQGTTHAELTRFSQVLAGLEGPRRERARQLFYWALLQKVPLEKPAELEQELHAAVQYLAGRLS